LTWIVKDATADTREVEFDVDGVSGAYRFGLALDPDLGKSPADDRSIYDAGSGALIAYDAGEAIGFVLRRSGQDDVVGVKQYGAREFAPRDPARLRQATGQAGVDLRTEPDDVQFIVSGSEASGPQAWTLLLARGDDPDDVAAKLEAVVGQ
jgi:hypothetical protein